MIRNIDDITQQSGIKRGPWSASVIVDDVNNDGLLEFYLGTEAFNFPAIVSKRVLQKNNGKDFQDVIIADRFGKLQKGNGVSFADFDNIGD